MGYRLLLTGAGGAAGIGFARAAKLAEHWIVAADCDRFNLFRVPLPLRRHQVPCCDSLNYIDALSKIAYEHKCDVIHSPSDVEIETLSRQRQNIGTRFLWPSHEAITTAQDKWLTFKRLHSMGIPVPNSMPICSNMDLLNAHDKWGSVWLRARKGAGGRGAIPSKDPTLSSAWMGAGTNTSLDWMAAEIIHGETFTHTSLWRDGVFLAGQGRKRIRWEGRSPSGVTGSTGVGMTVRDENLIEVAHNAVQTLDGPTPNGFYAVDCIRQDSSGKLLVTEINAGRPFTTVTEFFMRLGLNLADLYIRAAMGEDVDSRDDSDLPEGWLWIRGLDVEPKLVSPDETVSITW